MARYIDADKLLEELNVELMYESTMFSKEQEEYLQKGIRIAIGDVKRFPTADVVPKSEVERLEGELIVERTRRENAVGAYHEARQKIAREIFEEIEEKIEREVRFYKSVYDASCDTENLVKAKAYGRVIASGIIHDFIIELKKKYTEGEK